MAKKVVTQNEDNIGSLGPVCGVIMPISATANQSEAHWADVQTLLHRGIKDAGFQPLNVWENTAADRVSERIIANIFEQPLVVADISDLNPNVMLELGLRLASKKPTIVVVHSGGTIPFDIRDFHAIIYPSDLNILGMEDFFRKLAKALKEKNEAFSSDDYQPFLGKVVVDVISPGHREVSLDEAIVSQLQDISIRLRSLERGRKTPLRPRWIDDDEDNDDDDDGSVTTSSGRICYFTAKGDLKHAITEFRSQSRVEEVRVLGSDGSEHYLSVKVNDEPDEDELDHLRVDLKILGRRLGWTSGIRTHVIKRNGW